MKSFVNILSLGIALVAIISTPHLARAATLAVGGTGAVTEALMLIGPAFTKATGITLKVIPDLGTGGGIAATADGILGLAVAGRTLKEKEAAMGLKVVATFRTPFGLVTSRPGPDGLASKDIAAIYSADQATWPDGTPLRIILRPVGDSDTMVMGKLFPGLAEALETARLRPDLSVAANDQDNAAAAEKTDGSLVGITLTQIMTEKHNLRFVAIDGVLPSMASYQDGSYPYGKTLFMMVPTDVSAEATAFLSFLATPEGEAILNKVGILAIDE
ncbi:MAG: ABC-type phosphate transport system periplasmic component-like [Rhizobium sp.]|nr:ABC-type phosphate transport system periplasmic component-like [Rhizobium sp.]